MKPAYLLLPAATAAVAAAQKLAPAENRDIVVLGRGLDARYCPDFAASAASRCSATAPEKQAVISVPESSAPTDANTSDHDAMVKMQRQRVERRGNVASTGARQRRVKRDEGLTLRQIVGGIAVAVLVAVV